MSGQKLGHIGQISLKPCSHSRGHSNHHETLPECFSENFQFLVISVKFEYGLCRVKN